MLENNQPTTPILIEDLGMLYPNENSKTKYRYGVYLCECGAEFRTGTANVKNGHTKSCGCYNKQRVKESNTTHGLRTHKLYYIWVGVINRTTNQNNKDFKNYGGRGIIVCDEWRNDFKLFYDFAMKNGWEKGLEIDRRDNDKGYSPENCRVVSKNINQQNKRKLMSTNTSGYRGASFDKISGKWKAGIRINSKQKHLGYFETLIEAAKAYDNYVKSNGLEHTINNV